MATTDNTSTTSSTTATPSVTIATPTPAATTSAPAALTTQQTTVLVTDSSPALTSAVISALSSADVVVLGTGSIGALGTSTIDALTINEIAPLTDAASTNGPASLTTAAVAALTTAAATALSTAQVAAISTAAIPALTADAGSPTPVAPPDVPADPLDAYTLSITASVQAKLALEELKSYVRAMISKVVPDPKTGAAHQAGLYRAFLGIVQAPAADFKELMTVSLKLVHDYSDTVFHQHNVFRFMPHLTLNPATIVSFRSLTNMFTSLASPKARPLAVKQIDFDTTLQHKSIAESAKQRVMAFFGK